MKMLHRLAVLREEPAWKERAVLRRAALACVILTAFFIPLSIGFSQGFAAAGFLLWIITLPSGLRRTRAAYFLTPMVLFVLYSLITTAFSHDPAASAWSARNLLIFLIVPLVIHNVRGELEVRAVAAAFVIGSVVTVVWGVVEIALGYGGGASGMRLTGALGHYMTAGGILMFASLLPLAALLFARSRGERIALALFAAVGIAGTALTQSRNAYAGLFIGALTLALLWRRQLLLFLPFALSLAVLLAPPMVRERIFHMADVGDQSVHNRLYMVKTGLRMTADFPLFGVGMQQVKTLYNRFKDEEDPGDAPHLHNNLLQIAAERGLPALALWIWLIIAFGLGHMRLAGRPNAPPWYSFASSAAFVVLIAMLTAGMFEYNFGDAEVKMAFLLIVSIPFGLRRRNSMVRAGGSDGSIKS